MIQDSNSSIKTEIGSLPVDFDIAIASIDLKGTLGELNQHVLSSYGYDFNLLDKIDTSKGYYLMQSKNNKPILFIVTVGQGYPGINLKKNLTIAISDNLDFLKNKNVWIPLMGTGSGGLEFVDSYDTTIGVLKQFPKINFTISIPDDDKGEEFIKNFKVHNLISKNVETSAVIEVSDASGVPEPPTNIKLTQVEFDPNMETNDSFKNSKDETPPAAPTITNIQTSETKLDSDIKVKDNRDIKTELGDINYFLAGHIWDSEDQMDRFVSESIWENGHKKNDINAVNSVNEGDIVFIKSTFAKNKISYLRIKAIGVVFANFKDGHNLKVNWHLRGPIDIEGLGKYRRAFAKIQHDDISIVLEKILKEAPNLLEIINSLKKGALKLDKHKKGGNDTNKTSKKSNIEDTLPTPGISDSENNKIEEEIAKGTDKIPFHLDQIVDEDKLGREPVAKAFVDLIKKDIFTNELNHSFMVHLQGEWGAGKSSFLNFIKKNLNSGNDQWIVVDYNAWQNQHIIPPWWSFIDQVYLQAKKKFIWWYNRPELIFLEKRRRIIWYSGWHKIISLIVSLIFISIIIFNWQDIFSFIYNHSNNEKFNISDLAKLLVGFGSIIGLIYSFSKFVSTPLLLNSSGEAKSFVLRAKDPMNRIKNHFNDLVDNIHSSDFELAIFIDDIDRCNKGFIVNLLEGIQTLFKDKRVLYIVAGDKNWITTSFGNVYEDFSTESIDKKRLGEFFLEKAFQLSFRLPNISLEAKQNYWDYILGVKNIEQENKLESIEELSVDKQKEIRTVLSEAKSELTNPDFMRKIGEDFNLTGDTVSSIVIEEKNKDTEELKHLLQDFHAYIDTNPRVIIRLANNYTMTRSTLMAERAVFNEKKLFRWLVIEDLCPEVKSLISNAQSVEVIEEEIKKLKEFNKIESCLILLKDEDNKMNGEITIEEIKTIKGL